jgi:hypothetical protein
MGKMLIAGFVVLLTAGGCTTLTLRPYAIVSTVDKETDFASLRTYAWATGWPAFEEAQHEQIVAAVNRELAARHFTESADGHADVTVTYGILRREDADLRVAGDVPDRELPTFPVITLVVRMREGGTRRELFSVRADTPVQSVGTAATAIDNRIVQMFERYPERKSGHP